MKRMFSAGTATLILAAVCLSGCGEGRTAEDREAMQRYESEGPKRQAPGAALAGPGSSDASPDGAAPPPEPGAGDGG